MTRQKRSKSFFRPKLFPQLFYFTLLSALVPLASAFGLALIAGVKDFYKVLDTGAGAKLFLLQGIEINFTVIILFAFAYFLLLIASTVWSLRNRPRRRAIFLLPGFLLILMLGAFHATKAGWIDQDLGSFLFIISVYSYAITAAISSIYFCISGRIRSNAFALFLLIIGFFNGLPFVFLILFFFGLLRSIYLVVHQNISILKSIPAKRLVFLFFKALLFWLPLLLFVIPGEKLNNRIYESSIDGIYDYVFEDQVRVGDRKAERYVYSNFQKDLDAYVNNLFVPFEDQALRSRFERANSRSKKILGEAGKLTEEKKKTIPKEFEKIYREESELVFKDMAPYFKEDDCGWHIILPTSCCIMNGVKRRAYKRLRKLNDEIAIGVREAVRNELEKLDEKFKNNEELTQQEIDAISEAGFTAVNRKVKAFKNGIRNSIFMLFNLIIGIKLMFDLLLFIVIIKSFLVVFARVAFTANDEAFITLLDSDKRMAKGTIKKCGSQYTILSSNQSNFYASRSYEPSGRAPKFTIPQPFTALLGRLRTGTYALNQVVMKDRKGSVYYNALGGTEFVEWELKKGEVAIFDLKNFVAMSESITLGVTWSFRITSLLLGRLRFVTATGPGKLVLLTKGKPITSDERRGEASVPVSRIIAFQKNTRFHVESELNIVDMFLSGIYLKKKTGDPILIDADEKSSATSGISRFILSFLLPF